MGEVTEIKTEEKKLEGIGGWLLFYCICIGISILNIAIKFLPLYTPGKVIPYLSKSSATYFPAFGAILIFEGIINCSLVISLLIILYFFLRKRKFVPRLVIFFYSFNLLFLLSDMILTMVVLSGIISAGKILSGNILNLITSIISFTIWGLYFTKSKRVKNTFVN